MIGAEQATPEVVRLAHMNAARTYVAPRTGLAWRSALIGAITAIPAALIVPAATRGRLDIAAIALAATVVAIWVVPRLVIRPRYYSTFERRAFDDLGWCSWCHGHHTWKQCPHPERPRR